MFDAALPEPPDDDKKFNLYGFILYDSLQTDIGCFMIKHGGWISSASGDNCCITIFENPRKWGNVWKDSIKEIFGKDYESYLKKWENFDFSYRNTSHKVARDLQIPITMFPTIIFLDDLNSKKFIQYPLINDKDFYRELFAIVNYVADDPQNVLEKLVREMRKLRVSWFIPAKLGNRAKIFDRYANIFLKSGRPFINILTALK